jgi:hypothetical protein
MKEIPILFSAPMVRALLAGTKTQTRRAIRDQSIGERFSHMTDAGLAHLEWLGTPCCGSGVWDVPEHSADVASPYGQRGDRLWVRETHAPQSDCWGAWERWIRGDGGPAPVIHYAADFKPFQDGQGFTIRKPFIEKWRPSIHMPRWASRITLEVTDVRVERLQDISEADAQAEGVYTDPACPAYDAYAQLWDEINGAGSWDANPWVWAVSFRRIKP